MARICGVSASPYLVPTVPVEELYFWVLGVAYTDGTYFRHKQILSMNGIHERTTISQLSLWGATSLSPVWRL